jgi:ATP-binding cassette, subfamily C, bacterial
MGMLRLITGYCRDIWQYRPALTMTAVALMLARSLSEGAGLVLIIPLLALIGIGATRTDEAAAAGAVGALPDMLKAIAGQLSLEAVLGLFLFVVIVRALIGYAQQLTAAKLQTGFLRHVRVSTHDAVMKARWPYLALQDASRINHVLSVHAEQAAYGITVLTRIISAVLLAGVSVAVAMLIDLKLSLLVIGFAGLIALPVMAFDFRLYRMARQTAAQLEAIFAMFGRQLGDLKAAKAASGTGVEAAQFAGMADQYREAAFGRQRLTAAIGLFHELAGAVLLIGLVWLAAGQAATLQVGPIAVAVIFIRLFPALKGLQSSLRDLLFVLPAWERVSALKDAAASQRDDAHGAGSQPAPGFDRSLELASVGFNYPASEAAVLRGVDLVVRQGTATVILGLSGAGKTTLLDVISGLLKPDTGQLLIDGVPLADANRAQWCASVAYVVQDAQLSNGTVRENVARFAGAMASDEDVWRALRLAGAEEIVRKLPAGLDEEIGDRGQRLSRGQRQRIALARALIGRPRLLILDEATSALNPRDEELIAQNLRQLLPEVTMIIVAHKLGSLGWADSFHEMDGGSLHQVDAGDGAAGARRGRVKRQAG